MVFCALARASTSPRASLISFDCLSAVDPVVDVAHTVHQFLRFDAWQEMDGMISVFLSDPLISIERFSTLEMPGSIKEYL